MTKQTHIEIHRTNNGYLVVPSGNMQHCGRLPLDEQTWTFESMNALQRRLPEILDTPVEKIKARADGKSKAGK